jgi:hypothetical protein
MSVWNSVVAHRVDDGTDLRTLGFWPTGALDRLSDNWITTAEQLSDEEVREGALIYAFILDRLSAGTSLRGGELKHHRLPSGQSDRSHSTPA